jgi:hypothetical protein
MANEARQVPAHGFAEENLCNVGVIHFQDDLRFGPSFFQIFLGCHGSPRRWAACAPLLARPKPEIQ